MSLADFSTGKSAWSIHSLCNGSKAVSPFTLPVTSCKPPSDCLGALSLGCSRPAESLASLVRCQGGEAPGHIALWTHIKLQEER